MPAIEYPRLIALRTWIIFMAVLSIYKAGSLAVAQDVSPAKAQTNSTAITQDDSAAKTSLWKNLLDFRLGPFDLHPRLLAGLTYDDNILYATSHQEADEIETVQLGLQAVAGDDAALIAYRDLHSDVLNLAPGNLILQRPEDQPGRILILDYAPRFQIFDKYTANNSLDQFATFDLLWPMDKLILGFRQEYQLQKEAIIEAGERTTVEYIPTTLSAAYQFGEETSMESDFRRITTGYETPGLIGYTEYNTENWFNYNLKENLPVSLGVLAGEDVVANHQDQTYEQSRARARYIHSEKLSFDVSAGGELREFEGRNSATFSPVFTLAGQYQPAVRTVLRLTGYRQQFASIFNGYNYAVTGATLDVQQGITDRFTAALSAGYYSVDYTPIGRGLNDFTSGYYLVRISLDAKIVRHLTGQIFSQWVSSHSQISDVMNESQTGVQLTLSY